MSYNTDNDTIKDNNRDLKIIGYKNKRVNRKDGKQNWFMGMIFHVIYVVGTMDG